MQISTSDGESLEAVIEAPATTSRGSVLVCHPHPQHGGTMNAPLLVTLSASLTAAGYTVLRFNFRGTGASTGVHGGGKAEVSDVAAAVEALADAEPAFEPAICGWSFGGGVSLAYLHKFGADNAWIGIAPAVFLLDESALGATGDGNKLVIAGDRDQIFPIDTLEHAAGLLPGHVEFETLTGCDHFFVGRFAEQAAQRVIDFLEARQPIAAGT